MSKRQALMKELRLKISKVPRVTLATLPTPLHDVPRLSVALGGPRILFKRDDLTGLAFGGNKTRMFEFELAEAMQQGADTIVAGSAVQSNYLRQLAAACNRLGLEAHFVLHKVRGDKDLELQGNFLLDLLLGAHVRMIEESFQANGDLGPVNALAEALRNRGRKVYVPWWNTAHLNAIGYVNCALEMTEQLELLGLEEGICTWLQPVRVRLGWSWASDAWVWPSQSPASTLRIGLRTPDLKWLGTPAKRLSI